LKNAELRFAPSLPAGEVTQQLGPFDAGLGFNSAVGWIERNHPVQAAHVQQEHTCSELLPTHGVAASRNTDGQTFPAGLEDCSAELIQRLRANSARNASAVQLRMDVVDLDVLLCRKLCANRGKRYGAITDDASSGRFHRTKNKVNVARAGPPLGHFLNCNKLHEAWQPIGTGVRGHA
jgi:hypothetical protein